MKKVGYISLFLLFSACSAPSDTDELDIEVTELQDSPDELSEETTIQKDIFLTRFEEDETLDEIEDIKWVLEEIGALKEGVTFRSVVPFENGYRQTCDTDYEGILNIYGGEEAKDFFGLNGYFYDVSDLDTYYSFINHIDVKVTSEKLLVSLDYWTRDQEGNGMIDDRFEPELSEIWMDSEFGTVILSNGHYFLAESMLEDLPQIECPEYEP